MRMSIVGECLRDKAARSPAVPALVTCDTDGEAVFTWAELERLTSGMVGEISAAVSRPERSVVLAAIDNTAASVLDLIGLLRCDLPVAVVSAAAPEAEMASLRQVLLRAGYHVARARGGRVDMALAEGAPRGELPSESVLLTTGGSSGRPKVVVDAVMRTIGRRPRGARPSARMNWQPGQRQLVVGPLYHTAALTFFVEALSDGNTVIVQRSFDPGAANRLIGRWRVEWLQLTPYHMRHLALAARRAEPDVSNLRGLLHLAAPCPEPLKRHWLEALGPDRIFEMYGSSEGIGVTLARGDEWLEHPGTVGRGFFTQIRVVGEAGVPLPPGETGEIYMRSGTARRGVYLQGDDGIRATSDGFASVGDHGRLDAAGYLYLAPRQLDRIQIGGETVYPTEVESVLMEHSGVLDAAVLGVPDQRLGESLVAFVVPDGEQDGRVLRRYLRDHVSRHKLPREIRFVASLPYTENGKLDRRRLGARISGAGAPR